MERRFDRRVTVIFPVVPDGHTDHIRFSFEMATRGTARPTR
jgi:hypothetical protein